MAEESKFKVLHKFPPPELELAWRDFLGRVELPSHYCAPEFFREPFWVGKNPFAVLAIKGGDVVGVVTGLHEGIELQCGLPQRPQICVAGGADFSFALTALADGLLSEAGSAQLISIYSWDSLQPLVERGYRARPQLGDVTLDLRLGADALFKQFHEGRRKTIRRAMNRFQVEVRPVVTAEDIQESYNVYRKWHQTTRKKITWEESPFAVFEQAYSLRDSRIAFLARHEGVAIAVLSLRFYKGGLIEASGIHSIDEYHHLFPNELLHWRAIEWACREGFRIYSFGGSHTFLSRFGGDLKPVLRYRVDRSIFRRHNFHETISDLGRECLKKLPEPVGQKLRRVLGKA